MLAFVLALASFGTISNAHDYEVMRFECKPTVVEPGALAVQPPCEYEYLVIRDSAGKEHRYLIKEVRDRAIKELSGLEVKKKDEK